LIKSPGLLFFINNVILAVFDNSVVSDYAAG